MATHVKVIAVFFGICGAALLVGAVFSPLVLTWVADIVRASDDKDAEVAGQVLGFAAVTLSAVLVAFAIPYLLTAWGLFNFKPWARIVGIVLAGLCLIEIPFGTILGIYALVILFKKETEALFAVRA